MTARKPPLLRDGPLALLLLIAYGWLFVFFPGINNPNELVRLYMARAIAERSTYAIGQRDRTPSGRIYESGPLLAEWGYVNDKALACRDAGERPPYCTGTLYPAKAPGTSFLEVPVVAGVNAISAGALHRHPTKDEYVFWTRWLVVILPTVIFWLWLRRFLLALQVDPAIALTTVLAGALGSLSLTYGQQAAGHQLSSLFLGGALLAALWPKRSRPALLGFCLGAAVCSEYQAAPAGALIGLAWLLTARPPLRAVLQAALGAAPPLGLLFHFHAAAFGSIFRTPYSAVENPGFVQDLSPGWMGISLLSGERAWGSLISPTLGLFFWAPWTLLALPAGLLLWRGARARSVDPSTIASATIASSTVASSRVAAPARHPDWQGRLRARLGAEGPALVSFAVVAYYLLFQLNNSLWRSGWTVGPRYLTPLVPFAVVAIARWLQRLEPGARPLGLGLLAGAGTAGIAATGLASAVCQGFPPEAYNPLREIVLPLLAHGFLPRNPLQWLGVPGLWSGLPYFAALALAIAASLRAPLLLEAAPGLDAPLRRRGVAIGCAVAAALLLAQWTSHAGETPEGPKGAAFLASQWVPRLPPGATPF